MHRRQHCLLRQPWRYIGSSMDTTTIPFTTMTTHRMIFLQFKIQMTMIAAGMMKNPEVRIQWRISSSQYM
jgi:hypothetical protein